LTTAGNVLPGDVQRARQMRKLDTVRPSSVALKQTTPKSFTRSRNLSPHADDNGRAR
jgi:hypothetical protein